MAEFTSTEDGEHFIGRLERIPNRLLQAVATERRILPSQVDHLLAIVYSDQRAQIFINELSHLIEARVSRTVGNLEPVFEDDIVAIRRLNFGEIEIPEETGVLYLFSVGWRKGLFYDFAPLREESVSGRTYDVNELFGVLYAHLRFQNRFSITEKEWSTFFSEQWFPFIALSNQTIDQMITYIRSNWAIDELLDQIASEVRSSIGKFLEMWRGEAVFQDHIALFERAIERFYEEDYLSATSILFPRIEGLMRSHYVSGESTNRVHSSTLSEASTNIVKQSEGYLLMTQKFQEYLDMVYFANFDPNDRNINISRHSVGHGVADERSFSKKSAVIGILIVQQLYYCITSRSEN